ncbi:MAG: NF038122 family metalloprotease [Sphingomonas sp.]
MRMKNLLACSVAASVLVAAPAYAGPTINLYDNGFTGTPAQVAAFKAGFQIAASYWSSILTDNVTINLRVGTAALNPGVIGSTNSARADYSVANWENRVNLTKSGSTIDQTAILPTLTGGGASFITNGVNAATGNDDLTTLRYDNAATTSSKVLFMNSSLIKAIGGSAGGVTNTSIDGTVQFSSNFAFDFDPTDGVTAGTFDFIGVAIHEIGHALGFVSGVDFLDVYGEGPGTSPNEGILHYSLNDTSIYSALDMFRYSADPTNLVPGGPARDLSVGGTKYFSIDGGATALFGNTFSTGRFNGDGQQASHWKDASGANACGPQLGILDPTFCFGQMGEVTGLDLAAYDAMGWNLSVNALNYATKSTASIFATTPNQVPEPATWAMMIVGFGLMGGAMRRNRKVTARIRFA